MWLILLLIILALPVCSQAQYVGDLSPNPYTNNSIGNPFNSGGSWNSTVPRNANGGRTSPTSPYTWSNPLTTFTPPVYDRVGQFQDFNPLSPTVPTSGVGPYGITLPPNHPLRATSR